MLAALLSILPKSFKRNEKASGPPSKFFKGRSKAPFNQLDVWITSPSDRRYPGPFQLFNVSTQLLFPTLPGRALHRRHSVTSVHHALRPIRELLVVHAGVVRRYK